MRLILNKYFMIIFFYYCLNSLSEIMKKLYNIEHYLKGAIHFLLSLFLLTNGLHIDDHDHGAVEGYSICNHECDSSSHHSLKDNCEECVNNSNKQKLFFDTQSFSMIDTSNIILNEYYSPFTKDANCHYFGSRAPPNFL